MKILIAGAAGTLGLPLVRELVSRNHSVQALTRSSAKRKMLEQAGATAIIADALDAKAMTEALTFARPDAVIDILTAIPKNGPTKPAHMRPTNELRVKGTANLLQAAIAADVRRIIGESMIFAYGFGDHGSEALKEKDALQPREASPSLQEITDSIRSMEDQLLAANARGAIEAIPLRYGLLYGPDPATQYMLGMIQKRFLPTPSGGQWRNAWIHRDDAVRATVAALGQGHPGEIYNIVDDEPVGFEDWARCAAELLGAPRPISVPVQVLRWMMPYVAAFLSTSLIVSNAHAKRELDWRPQFPSYREGLQQAVAEYQAHVARPGQAKMTRMQT